MHKIHITEGLVLGKRGVGEANSRIAVLTREMGLVFASARSSRVEASKLRYGLEPLTIARYSFVRGKTEWRLVGVHDIDRTLLHSTPATQLAFGRISKLLSRLLAGEEPHTELYVTLVKGLEFLSHAKTADDADALECVLVLRLLSHLGYVAKRPELEPFMDDPLFSVELAASAARSRVLLIKTINESLQQSGL
jgi:DNA repair protein RecO